MSTKWNQPFNAFIKCRSKLIKYQTIYQCGSQDPECFEIRIKGNIQDEIIYGGELKHPSLDLNLLEN